MANKRFYGKIDFKAKSLSLQPVITKIDLWLKDSMVVVSWQKKCFFVGINTGK